MLKMGKMCHCSCTLYRLDPDDGSIVWRVNRGVAETQLAVSGSNVYSAGSNVTGKTDGRVIKRTDSGTDAPVDWWSDRNGFTSPTAPGSLWTHANSNRESIVLSDNGYLWVLGTNGLGAYDQSTGLQTGAYTTLLSRPQLNSSGLGHTLCPGASGALYAITNANLVSQFNTSAGLVASGTAPADGTVQDICILGGGDIVVAVRGGVSWKYLQRINTSLALQEQYPAAAQSTLHGIRVEPISTNDVLLITENVAGTSRLLKRFSVNSFSETWSTSIGVTGNIRSGNPLVVDASTDDIFLLEDNDAVMRDSSGTEQWRTDLGSMSASNLAEKDIQIGSDFVVVSGISGSSPYAKSVVCLEKADGSIRWEANHANGDVSCAVGASDEIYVIGIVGALSSPL